MNLKRAVGLLAATGAALALSTFGAAPAGAEAGGNCSGRICVASAHIDHYVQDMSAWVTDGQPGTIHLWDDKGDDVRQDNVTRVAKDINAPRDPGTVFCAELFRNGSRVDYACWTLP